MAQLVQNSQIQSQDLANHVPDTRLTARHFETADGSGDAPTPVWQAVGLATLHTAKSVFRYPGDHPACFRSTSRHHHLAFMNAPSTRQRQKRVQKVVHNGYSNRTASIFNQHVVVARVAVASSNNVVLGQSSDAAADGRLQL